MIRREDILRIMDAVRIEEVVGEYVSLKKRGSSLIGLCPFHNEKTPSFNVSPSLNIFKCFGCGKAGNAVNFLMEYEHYTYPEALRKLAAKFGVEIVEEEADDDYKEKKTEEDQSYFVHEFAQKWFDKQLWETKEGMSVGLSYFHERGLSDAIIKKFGLGYSPQSYSAFADYARSEGFDKETLAKNGLINGESGNDRFRDRIIFPIYSISGRVIAFGGRTLKTDKKIAKYVNSPETPIYHKSNVLYGIHLAKNSIISQNECYLVEGYMDVIAMVQAGINNVVASSGTSLTGDQIRMIRRYTSNICVLYDGDLAGIKASFRAIDMLLAEGLDVRVVLFPDNEDPDSYSRKYSAKALMDFLEENKKSFVLFKAEILFADAGSDPLQRAGAMKDIVRSIAEIPDGISRSLLVSECAKLFNIEEKTLMFEMNKILRAKTKKLLRPEEDPGIDIEEEIEEKQQPISGTDRQEESEKNILNMLLLFGDKTLRFQVKNPELKITEIVEKTVAQYIIEELEADAMKMTNQKLARIYDTIRLQFHTDGICNSSRILNMLDPNLTNIAADIMNSVYALSPNWEKKGIYVQHTENDNIILMSEVDSAVLEFKHLLLLREMDSIRKKLQEPNNEEDELLLVHQFQMYKTIDVEIEKKIRQRVINK
ncbi:DNA primase [bioreactor metagenome]|uniref:DNA primase n=1 Tax=bioreactor metagenome TaxID=1076179 RepID=A0A644XBE0_9ZZZZ